MDTSKLESLTLSESIDFLNSWRGCNNLNSGLWTNGRQDGNLYNLSNVGGGAFYTYYIWLNQQAVNKWQRYAGRMLYMSNAYAGTAVNNLTILALGNGLEFQCADETKLKKIQKWIKNNKWRQRDLEGFKRFIVDGEIFYRATGFQEDAKIRFVDPDYVYNTYDAAKWGWYGARWAENDYEEITKWVVHKSSTDSSQGEEVSTTEKGNCIQQRANKHFTQFRGFSWLLPVMSDLWQADKLTNNLMQTSELLSKIAFWRVNKANKEAVERMRSEVSNNTWLGQNGTPSVNNVPRENLEGIPPQSILDIPDSMDIKFPQALNGSEYNALLDSTLRKISSHFHLPTGVFNDKSERGAYAAELVSSSYIVRSIEAIQENWKEWNLQLLELCGFDTEDVDVVCPEVAMVDKKMESEVADMLLRNQIASRQTVGTIFGIDYDAEKPIIKKENAELNTDGENNENIDRNDGLDGSDTERNEDSAQER